MAAGPVVGLQEAGVSFEMATNAAPAVYTGIEVSLRDAAQKALNEGNAKAAVDQLKNTGNVLKPDEAEKQARKGFKEDSLNGTNDALAYSADQTDRENNCGSTAHAIANLAEKGYDSLPAAEATLLRNQLSDTLFNHPVFQVLAESQGVSLTTPNFKTLCDGAAISFLKNSNVSTNAKNALVDALVSGKIDYKNLQVMLKNKIQMEKSYKDLADEVGNDGTNSNPKTGLELEIDNKKDELKRFKFNINSSPPPPMIAGGVEAQIKLDAQNENAGIPGEIYKLNAAVQQINNHFTGGVTSTINITDPITGATVGITTVNMGTKLGEYSSQIAILQEASTNNKAAIEEIDRREAEAKQQLKDIEASLKQKRKELKDLKTAKDKKDDEIKAEQDVVMQKEIDLLQSIKKCIDDSALGEWAKTYEAVKGAKPEAQKKAEDDIHKMAKEMIDNRILDHIKKAFKSKELDKEFDSLLEGGLDKYGANYLGQLIAKASLPGASPELKLLLPHMLEMSKDSTKMKALSTELANHLLKGVVTKDPNKLKNKLFNEQIKYASFTQDVLPSLILQAANDPGVASELQQYVGKELTKSKLSEVLRGADWKKILLILAIILGLVGGVAVLHH